MNTIKAKLTAATLFTALLLFVAPVTTSAQDYNKDKTRDNTQQMQQKDSRYSSDIKDLAQDLKTKVNLTEDQMKQVEAVLTQYQKSARTTTDMRNKNNQMDNTNRMNNNTNMNSAKTTANKSIETILKDDQKSKWNNVKEEWWNKVDSQLKTTNKTHKME